MTLTLNKINVNQIDKKILYLLLILNSFFFTFYYGFKGIFPLDSFLIFDAGFKVLNGAHPFKDYWSITGPILDYIQSILFFLFDVSWFSYVLHAAIINCLLVIIIFYFFDKIGLKKIYSFLYTLSVSILAYPSVGTPFMDHHSTIFSLISIVFFILAFLGKDKKFWFLSSLFLIFSFFSKQIPAAYILITFGILILIYKIILKNSVNKNIIYFFLGGSIGIIIFLGLFLFNQIPLNNFLIQYIYYPITIGEERVSNIYFDLQSIFLQFKFIYFSILPIILIAFFIMNKKINYENKKDLLVILSLISTFIIFIYSQLITKNQILIFFLIPFYLGLSHYYIEKYFNRKIFQIFLIIFLIGTTIKYHITNNENKKFMELSNANFSIALDGEILDKKLKGVKWITPRFTTNPEEELRILKEIKEIIIQDKSKKIIITNYQIFNSITNNLNFAPNKWFDPRSVPSKNNKYSDNYKKFFIQNIKKQNIKNIYTIGKNKVKYFSFININNCMKYEQLNELLFLAKIEDCLN